MGLGFGDVVGFCWDSAITVAGVDGKIVRKELVSVWRLFFWAFWCVFFCNIQNQENWWSFYGRPHYRNQYILGVLIKWDPDFGRWHKVLQLSTVFCS